MKNLKLLIFVDGLGKELTQNANLTQKWSPSFFAPGIGFSNNLYPEMLCGKNPDQMGYFNEWYVDIKPKSFLEKLILPLDLLRRRIYINAGLRKLILHKVFRKNYGNIPFRYVNYFSAYGSHDFRVLGPDSLLEKYNFKIVDSVEERRETMGARDFIAIKKITNEIREKNYQGNFFLSLVDIDNLQHVHGMDHKIVINHTKRVFSELQRLILEIKKNTEIEYVIFSDHGMTGVTEYCDLGIEKQFGLASPDSYLYFVDATYARFWFFDDEKRLQAEVVDWLRNSKHGKVLSTDERRTYGIETKAFGDIMFRADVGKMFLPNFFGSRRIKAMHGYDSTHESQSAFICSNINSKLPTKCADVHSYLESICSG
jgi:hypothetical protein